MSLRDLCLATPEEFDCNRCSDRPDIRRRNGCDVAHKPGHGLRTILGTEILRCPRRDTAPNVAAWLQAFSPSGGELSFTESSHASPVLVEAFGLVRSTQQRIATAMAEQRKREIERGNSH